MSRRRRSVGLGNRYEIAHFANTISARERNVDIDVMSGIYLLWLHVPFTHDRFTLGSGRDCNAHCDHAPSQRDRPLIHH